VEDRTNPKIDEVEDPKIGGVEDPKIGGVEDPKIGGVEDPKIDEVGIGVGVVQKKRQEVEVGADSTCPVSFRIPPFFSAVEPVVSGGPYHSDLKSPQNTFS
jgi:hypothetical protein